MRLLIERSQRTDWLGRRWYRLDIRAEANEVEHDIVRDHKLDAVDLWLSPTALSFEGEAVGQFEAAKNTPGWGNSPAWRRLRLNRDGLAAVRASARESGVTVGDLLAGVAHEAREISELSALEAGARAGFEALQRRLELLARYETKDVYVVDAEKDDSGVPPARWVTLR